MSVRAVNQNNVIAGSFVIAGILLAVLLSFILGDIASSFGDKASYTVRFPTTVGVTGLQAGAEVTFAGLAVGRVESVSMYLEERTGSGVRVPGAMDVVINLDADLVLYENAIADLAPPILGGVSRINISSAGDGPSEWSVDADGILDEGEVLAGRFAPSILRQMGFTAEETQKILDMIDKFPVWTENVTATTENVADTTERISRMAAKLEPSFNSGVDDGRSTIENIRRFSDRLHGEGGWTMKVDSVLDDVQSASSKIDPTIDEIRGAVVDAREIVDENRGKVGRILDNVESSTERIRLETIDQMNSLLGDGALAMGSARELLSEANGVLVENRPRVNATMSNVQQISLQGKLMVEEFRSMPWRVLNKPTKEDLRREPLYEAARSYASAVSELRSASESLDTAVRIAGTDGGAGSLDDAELTVELRRLAELVERAYGRYEEAEHGLLGLLAGPS